jgi:hypothetical protein
VIEHLSSLRSTLCPGIVTISANPHTGFKAWGRNWLILHLELPVCCQDHLLCDHIFTLPPPLCPPHTHWGSWRQGLGLFSVFLVHLSVSPCFSGVCHLFHDSWCSSSLSSEYSLPNLPNCSCSQNQNGGHF